MELNQGHMDFQSIALPPELRYLVFVFAFAKVVFYFISTKDTNEKLSPLILLNSSAFAYNCPADCTPKQKMDSKLVRLNIGLNSAKKQKKLLRCKGCGRSAALSGHYSAKIRQARPGEETAFVAQACITARKTLKQAGAVPTKPTKLTCPLRAADLPGSGPPGMRISRAADLTSR